MMVWPILLAKSLPTMQDNNIIRQRRIVGNQPLLYENVKNPQNYRMAKNGAPLMGGNF
jgi:hypothetical protein